MLIFPLQKVCANVCVHIQICISVFYKLKEACICFSSFTFTWHACLHFRNEGEM